MNKNLRNTVFESQKTIGEGAFYLCSLPLVQQAWAESAGQPLEVRYNTIEAKHLEALRFSHSQDELLIGRIKGWIDSPEKNAAARKYLEESGKLASPGQTGHCEPYYDLVFDIGLDGLKEKVKKNPSFCTACNLLIKFIENAASFAVREDTAEICRHIAHKPPRTFRDAIQLIWFIDLAIQTADNVALVGPGRLDRRLGKFYDSDIASGVLTREDALQMIAELYLFINNYCGRGLAYAVMVGGSGIYNEVSYLALEALRETRLVYPGVGVCWEKDTPADLRQLAVDLIAEGISNVAIFNDELIKKSMIYYGIPEKNAGEYINSTCVEITPCGDSNVWVASNYFSLCSIMLDLMKHSTAATMEDFLTEYKNSLGQIIKNEAEKQSRYREIRMQGTRRPMQSIFTKGCIESGIDIEAGGAGCNWVECSFVGLANLVDSLVVIKHEVFKKKNFTLIQLYKILENNFDNCENIRLRFLNHYPKYGNDSPEADDIIPEICRCIIDNCAAVKIYPGDTKFIPGLFCWEMHQRLGAICPATPDGRRSGFPFADGSGPAQGREKNGPTAAVKSICSWNHLPMLGGSAFNQRYSAATVASEEARKKLECLIDVFIRCGGFETQINILDAETLQKAVSNPDEYSDLVVRIGGYTDYFTGLSPEMQKEVIMRTIYNQL